MANYPRFLGTSIWTVLYETDPNWIEKPILKGLSWYTESLSPTHEILNPPERLLIGWTATSLWLIDPISNQTWLSFSLPTVGSQNMLQKDAMVADCEITSAKIINGTLFVTKSGTNGAGLYAINLVSDGALFFDATGIHQYLGRVSDRFSGSWTTIGAPLTNLIGGNALSLSVMSGPVPLVSYLIDTGEANFIQYRGINSTALGFSDVGTFDLTGGGWIPDTDIFSCMGTNAAGANELVITNHFDNDLFLSATTLTLADVSNGLFGFTGDVAAVTTSPKLHGYFTMDQAYSTQSLTLSSTDVISEGIKMLMLSTEAGRLSCVRSLRDDVFMVRNLDAHAVRPFCAFDIGADWLWANFGLDSISFTATYNPWGAWVWNNATTDISRNAINATAVGVPVFNQYFLPLDGATQYLHAANAMEFDSRGFNVFGTFSVTAFGTNQALIAKYNAGALPANDAKTFRLYVSAAGNLVFNVFDNSVCQAGVDTYLGRQVTDIATKIGASQLFQVIAIYRGNQGTSQASCEIWINGERRDDANNEANIVNFVEVESTVTRISIGVDYNAGAAAHFLGGVVSRVGLDLGVVNIDSVPEYYRALSPIIPNENGLHYMVPLTPAVFGSYANWDTTSESPANTFYVFDGAADYLVAPADAVPLRPTTTGFYCSFWFNADNPSATNQTLISKGQAQYEIALGDILGGAADAFVHVNFGMLADLVSTQTIVAGQWNHVAVYWDHIGGTLVLFVNGQIDATAYAGPITDLNTAPFYVGARDDGLGGMENYFVGALCGLRFCYRVPQFNDAAGTVGEMVYREYIDGKRNMERISKMMNSEAVDLFDNQSLSVLTGASPRYRYLFGEDGHVIESTLKNTTDADFRSYLYYDQDSYMVILQDGSRVSYPKTPVPTTWDAIHMAARNAVESVRHALITGVADSMIEGIRSATFQPTIFDLTVASAPGSTLEDNFTTLDFDAALEEQVFLVWKVNNDFKPGGTMGFDLDFFVDAPDLLDTRVLWGIEYKFVDTADVFDFTAGTTAPGSVAEIIDSAEANKTIHTITRISIDTTGIDAGQILLLRVFRDATDLADNYSGDARMTGARLVYSSDRLGL